MGKIVLCIAASLDGYIADSEGKVDFLFEKPRIEPDEDYKAFYEELDSIVFGSETYRQIVEDMSPGKWLYPDKKCYVFTQHTRPPEGDVLFTGASPTDFVRDVASKSEGTVWLFGGRKLIRSFLEEDLIDRYWIYTMPVVLGGGVPLFTPGHKRLDLKLAAIAKVDDITKALYDRIR